MLSPKTKYAAYLVFKFVNGCNNSLPFAKSNIRFVNYESEIDAENQANTVHLPILQESGGIPKNERRWMEVKLRYFDSKKGTVGPVEARFLRRIIFIKLDSLLKELSFVQNEKCIWEFKFYMF